MSFSFVAFSWTRLPCDWRIIDGSTGSDFANFELRNMSYKCWASCFMITGFYFCYFYSVVYLFAK
jgi:hypothetical protein